MLDSSWSETTLTWLNAPLAQNWASGEQNGWTPETWREFDVTGAVTGNGTYTFGAATSLNAGLLDFWSKESGLYVPELVVTSRPGP